MSSKDWSWPKRFAFRFAFVYFATYLVTASPVLNGPLNRALRAIVVPAYGLFFGDAANLPPAQGSTGNNFTMVLAALLLAIVVTPMWCALRRDGTEDDRLHLWLRWAIRYYVLAVMAIYGIAKVIQFGHPVASQMLQPVGSLTPMNVLWLFMGTSKSYSLFAGFSEALGGMLMLWRRTTMLGALVTLAVMTNVWLMNVLYDVPVKVLSLHLVLLSIFLLLPELQRLTNFFVLNRATEPAAEQLLFEDVLLRRAGNVMQALVVVCVAGFAIALVSMAARERPVSPLQGIWIVEEFEAGGTVHPALATDEARWRRVVFDFPQTMAIQRMSDAMELYGATLNLEKNSLKLSRPGDSKWGADFKVERPTSDEVVLAGSFDGEPVKAKLKRVPTPDFPLARLKFR